MSNIDALADQVFGAVKGYVASCVGAVAKRLDDLESRLAEIPAGKDGAPGQDGAPGKDGEPGKDGVDGKDGAPGLDGTHGKDGEPGKDGETGPQGDRGESGLPGEKGLDGANGLPGQDGQDGRDGMDGKDGKDGRDALDIDILPEINPEKSYARGTFASHAGGLVRAVRSTEPVADGDPLECGWSVVIDGVAGVTYEQTTERAFKLVTVRTSGEKSEHEFSIPVMLYRGVYKAGTQYAHGDTATWDGSTWHCEVDTKAEPGNGSDWRLMVKRGAPGKDGQSIRGEKGETGRPGRDLTKMAPDGSKY